MHFLNIHNDMFGLAPVKYADSEKVITGSTFKEESEITFEKIEHTGLGKSELIGTWVEWDSLKWDSESVSPPPPPSGGSAYRTLVIKNDSIFFPESSIW